MPSYNIEIEEIHRLTVADLEEISNATCDAVRDGIGFNWSEPPAIERLENYWRGVLIVPNRKLFIGRLDGTIAGAIQLVTPTLNKETSAFSARITNHFVAPWARGHGIAKKLLEIAEKSALISGYEQITLDVRATQSRAINLYESHGYQRWGNLEKYEKVDGIFIAGIYYCKELN